jgi:hypothetical protein
VATGAVKTDMFLGERYRRLVRRRANSVPLQPFPGPFWSLSGTCSPTPPPASPTLATTTWPRLLGHDYYDKRIDKQRRARNLVRRLQALGLQVTLIPAA